VKISTARGDKASEIKTLGMARSCVWEKVGVGAGQAAAHMPADLRAMFVNAPGPTSYPIAGFSWVLVDNQKVSQPLVDLLTWMVHDGQQYAQPLYYAPLPPQVVSDSHGQWPAVLASGAPDAACFVPVDLRDPATQALPAALATTHAFRIACGP
jgi:hypothetical protein